MKLPASSVRRTVQNFAGVQLGDPRRKKRVQKIVAKLARRPSASLPAALGSEAEVEGAYRLMNNRHVRFEVLQAVHAEITRQRAEEAKSVLVLHDTTSCKFPDLDPKEIGYLQTGKAGFYLHLSLVVEAATWKRPLGVAHAEPLFRARRSRRGRSKRKVSGPETATWKNRESKRWWRGVQSCAETLKNCDKVVHVADREGDNYELIANTVATGQGLIIRVRVDRRARTAESDTDGWSTVKEVAASCDGMLERDVPLSRRRKKSAPGMGKAHPPRKARIARLRFAASKVVIPRPIYLRDPMPEQLELNLVHVVEVGAPPDEPAVEWLLYTTESVNTPEEVTAIVDAYRARWTIEEFNGALKTGCAYESRKFESRHALLTMLALSLPVACEVLWLRSRARSSPSAPATEVLTALQIRILRKLSPRKLPKKPTVEQALFAVAALGGHWRSNGPPGWKILQRGMTQLISYEVGWDAARQAARRGEDL